MLRKRIKAAVFTLFFIMGMLFFVPARADIIYEPDNEFSNTHHCTLEDAAYVVNTTDDVDLYLAPDAYNLSGTVPGGGTAVHVSYSWLDEETGQRWCCVTYWEGEQAAEGWTRAENLFKVYNSNMFRSDYAGRIKEENGTVDDSFKYAEIYFYSYPGGPEDSHMKPFGEMPD
ncbi:MAG: hypothetical protein IKR59_10520 [Lachnospiraceae bacterium]|nr:hypothetical protein [Lachnospiraceae bacterium]